MSRRRAFGAEQVEAVGGVEIASASSRTVRVAVLPDDPPRVWIDDDDAVPVVVVHADEAVRKTLGEAWVIERARAGGRVVGPEDPTGAIEFVDASRAGVVGYQVAVGPHLLGVR